MSNNLLMTEEQEINFVNIKAKQKIAYLDDYKQNLENDIKEAIIKSEKIFTKYNAKTNYISELVDIDDKIAEKQTEEKMVPNENVDRPRYGDLSLKASNYKKINYTKDELLDQRSKIEDEIHTFVDNLPEESKLSVKEDLDFYLEVIKRRKDQIFVNRSLHNEIVEEYPDAEKLDYTSGLNMYPFTAIHNYTDPKEEIAYFDEGIKEDDIAAQIPTYDENNKVIKISQAPKALTDGVSKTSLTIEETKDPEEINQSLVSDNSFYGKGDALTAKINGEEEAPVLVNTKEDKIAPMEEEVSEQNPDQVFDDIISEEKTDDSVDSKMEEPDIEIQNEKSEDIIPEIKEEPIKVKEEIKDPEEKKVPVVPEEESIEETEKVENAYTMEEGDTLASIAKLMCDDKDGWYDIYYLNKEILEKQLKLKEITDYNDIENNKSLFTGVTILIPNIFKKEKSAEIVDLTSNGTSMKKAA